MLKFIDLDLEVVIIWELGGIKLGKVLWELFLSLDVLVEKI